MPPDYRAGILRAMDAKQRAAEAAVQLVSDSTVIGLGSGTTADRFLVALSDALRAGRLQNVQGVATSLQTARRAQELTIPIVSLSQVDRLDLTIDGADEISPRLELIKGLGGALLREKIVAQNSRRLIIIADSSKRVARLGDKAPLPVEVVTFEHEIQAEFLGSLGCRPVLRQTGAGEPFVTDNGNYIYDCRFEQGIDDPAGLDRELARRAGIVESGLFLHLAEMAIVADENGVTILRGS